jgi:predicted helicase
MTIAQYLDRIQSRFKLGNATEHTYRGDLQQLIEALVPDVSATNEPKRIACGAPDYIIMRKKIPLGYIEAKDVGFDLGHKQFKGQFDRYRKSLDNLIITDYLDFWFYVNGEFTTKIRIAETEGNNIKPLPQNFEQFASLIRNFCTYVGQTIRSANKLSVMMADKAKLLSQIIEAAVTSDEDTYDNSTLKEQMYAFKDILIHDIKPKEFADVYAQTIAYGMFAARLHDPTLPTFSRQEAAELIPKTNPFLRKLFQYVAGVDLDPRIVWIVDALAEIFRFTDVAAILKNFGKATQTHDPIIHFYETFLAEYDPALRKARGVWYTPAPVVNFIVRAVDDILKTEFNLPKGLADNSKIKIKQKTVTKATTDQRSKLKEVETEVEVHKVQILDPATGTGTFLAEVVKHVYSGFSNMQGAWSSYAENHLIPRLNGFELLMASYAMAHLKLDMLLAETGFKSTKNQRFKIYLTNSLEEYHKDTDTLFASWLSTEANDANHIKRDAPVMVVMGNPPYSGESANKGDWIMSLMEDYKKEPGGKEKLKERNPKWINDDYVKFLRYGQYFIEKNGEGILAFINPHGFLDNPTFRGMRWNLLKTYDKIYSIDLHGNAKKKEVSPDGSPDINVFDIQQGVSINLFIKTGRKRDNELAQVYLYNLYGKREEKYKFLNDSSLRNIEFLRIENRHPEYYFASKDYEKHSTYESGFFINSLFNLNTVGIVTSNDAILIDTSILNLTKKVGLHYNVEPEKKYVKKIMYRPFDNKFVYYNTKLIERAREKVMKHFTYKDNIGLVTVNRQPLVNPTSYYFITDSIISNGYIRSDSVSIDSVFPLYLYTEETSQATFDAAEVRTPNLNKEIVQQIATGLNLTFTNEKETTEGTFAPIDLLDYIYAVLHSPAYREKYKEFLKIDFPRVPYPSNTETFWQLVKLGGQLRTIHLLESPVVSQYITSYPINGDNVVTALRYEAGRVYINQTQYFDNVPAGAWQFYIGGYQPAQKWLKDRKGCELSFEDIIHYQSIIVALHETEKLMQQIDEVGVEPVSAEVV